MSLNSRLEKHVETVTGLSIKEIRSYSPEQMRKHLEQKNKKKFSFVSEFPFIGRGNVLRDNIKTTKSIDKELKKIIG